MHTDLFNQRLKELERKSLRFIESNQDVDDTHKLTINSCGSCVACCIHPAISAQQFRGLGMPYTQDKPYGQKCVHCTGVGCKVYDVRPSVCRGYQCLWKLGLVDAPPNLSGVAWSFEPDYETMRGWGVVGNCDSVDSILTSDEHLTEIKRFFTIRLLHLPVNFVIVRDTKSVNMLKPRHGNRFLVRTCDLDPKANAIASTERKWICTFVQKGEAV